MYDFAQCKQNRLQWIGGDVELIVPDPQTRPIVLADDVELEGPAIVLVQAKVVREADDLKNGQDTCVLEPNISFINQTGVMVARVLVDASKYLSLSNCCV